MSEKKYGCTGSISEKTEVLYAELNERAEVATGSYSVTRDSLQYIYSVSATKNHRNIRSRSLVHEFSFTDVFNDINHGYRAAILKKNSLWLLSHTWLWLVICIMKRCTERCALQLYQTSFIHQVSLLRETLGHMCIVIIS